ncbi:unnamed protein product, partial [Dibothriocephalus latus]
MESRSYANVEREICRDNEQVHCFLYPPPLGKPIQCWIPQEFTRGWEEYAENYCWVANTYFAMVDKKLPPDVERPRLQLVYYQWAPIELAVQALLFCLPCLIWRLGVLHSGFNLHRVLQLAADA